MSADRQPALHRRVDPVAAGIPDRIAGAKESRQGPIAEQRDRLDTTLQVRVRASTRARLDEAVRKLTYERRERHSLASITDEALDTWLSKHGL